MAGNYMVYKRMPACHARRGVARQLPEGIRANSLVQTLRGKGYWLHTNVRIRGRRELGLAFCQDERQPELAKG